ncbi:MmcQ/YjbR family DNA-binding protein [Isoptericola sp. NPDC057391]|uniref:MmcQ/YjbR family DNA-binding protein n=1 Tax=Isoptericola sp. NPDC057391 TaxID=3346117 RepID=UPI00362584BA
MATFDDVARLAAGLPEVSEGERYRGWRAWAVRRNVFAWERPFSKADVRRFGDAPVPDGPILAVSTEDLQEKEAVLAAHPSTCLTIPHLDGYPAVLVRLDAVEDGELRELVVDAWFAKAPPALAAGHRDLLG